MRIIHNANPLRLTHERPIRIETRAYAK